ncbi:MAG: hypothetical protein J1E85_05355 [Ruminococcus sp.]|nr:hypothetical protein [Ruminococcus sp.]
MKLDSIRFETVPFLSFNSSMFCLYPHGTGLFTEHHLNEVDFTSFSAVIGINCIELILGTESGFVLLCVLFLLSHHMFCIVYNAFPVI